MITLQLSSQVDFASKVIRFATWSPYSHVDCVLPDGRLLGARLDGGVQIRPPDYGNFAIKSLYACYSFTPDQEKKFYDFLHDQVDKPYDWRGIVNFALHRNHYWREMDSWFCSELQLAASEAAGNPFLNLDDCDRASPRDLTLSTKLALLSTVRSGPALAATV